MLLAVGPKGWGVLLLCKEVLLLLLLCATSLFALRGAEDRWQCGLARASKPSARLEASAAPAVCGARRVVPAAQLAPAINCCASHLASLRPH